MIEVLCAATGWTQLVDPVNLRSRRIGNGAWPNPDCSRMTGNPEVIGSDLCRMKAAVKSGCN
jgi:hypothetical protein